MATKHNTFIRRSGNMAIIITVTDWKDYEELNNYSMHSNPDFLVGAVTTKSIYSSMLPNIVVDTSKPVDITEGTKGMGLAGIFTEGIELNSKYPEKTKHLEKLQGGIWAYKQCGLTYSEQESKPTFTTGG